MTDSIIIYWDHRNGVESYPYPHNTTHGWQQCPVCSAAVRTLEIACDYRPSVIECHCGARVNCPGIRDRGRFSGLEAIIRAAEGKPPVAPGEVPVNCSESVREEFESMARTGLFG